MSHRPSLAGVINLDGPPSNNPVSKCCDLWLTVLTKAPLCVCLFQLAICITLSIIGIMSSMETYNQPFKVDLDFANYLGATTELFMNQEAHSAAQHQQIATLATKTSDDTQSEAKRQLFGLHDPTTTSSWFYSDLTDPHHERNLVSTPDKEAGKACTKSVKGGKKCLQKRWHWSLNLYYRPKIYCPQGAEDCMFQSEILNE